MSIATDAAKLADSKRLVATTALRDAASYFARPDDILHLVDLDGDHVHTLVNNDGTVNNTAVRVAIQAAREQFPNLKWNPADLGLIEKLKTGTVRRITPRPAATMDPARARARFDQVARQHGARISDRRGAA